jgi:ferritin-like metal-binding protein YciE
MKQAAAQQTLSEEKKTGETLSSIAETAVNAEAA